MSYSAEEFYRNHSEKQAEHYTDENLAEGFLELRKKFTEKSGEKLLDAGCGHGRDTEYFYNQGLNPTGIDISDELIEIARNRFQPDFQVMDFRNLDFESKEFDSVWASASIFFVPPEDMEKVIKEFYRVLKPGGDLFTSMKIGDGEPVLNEKWGSKVKEYPVEMSEARKMFESAGFSIERKQVNKSENGSDFVSFICTKPKES